MKKVYNTITEFLPKISSILREFVIHYSASNLNIAKIRYTTKITHLV